MHDYSQFREARQLSRCQQALDNRDDGYDPKDPEDEPKEEPDYEAMLEDRGRDDELLGRS